MKSTCRASMLIGLIVAAGAAFATPASASVSFDFFYSNLSHDGHWVVSASYGRVWQPTFYYAGWHPYYDGHWVYTDLGWTWVSDYAWGNIPYHYGTWAYDAYAGWVWVPGYVWAPSWVVFSTGPDYIGWAPVPPRYAVGVSIGHCSPDRYVFVDSHHFVAPSIRRYAVPVSRNRTLVASTRFVNDIRVENNVVVNRGPSVRDVERWSGRRVAAQSIERVPRAAARGRFTRDDLRVDSGRIERGVRATESVTDSRHEHARSRGSERAQVPQGRSTATAPPRASARASQTMEPSRSTSRPPSSLRRSASANGGHAKGNGPERVQASEPAPQSRSQHARARGVDRVEAQHTEAPKSHGRRAAPSTSTDERESKKGAEHGAKGEAHGKGRKARGN